MREYLISLGDPLSPSLAKNVITNVPIGAFSANTADRDPIKIGGVS